MGKEVKEAKICAVCGDSFMTSQEFNNFCPKCFRQQGVDLLIADQIARIDPTQFIDKHIKELQTTGEEYMKKAERSLKRSKVWMFAYLGVVLLYIGFVVADWINEDNYTILRYKTACHDADYYVAGDRDYRCEECDRDVTAEVLHVLEETKGSE